MTTTCEQIHAAARALLGGPPRSIPSERAILERIRADQQVLFTSMAGVARGRFQTTGTLTSTAGSAARTFDLTALALPLERLVKVVLADTRECNQVDILDPDAELSPRYTAQGTTLTEVSNDWSAASGTVTATVTYVYGPTAIDPTGLLSQPVTVPDAWTDLLVLPHALWLCPTTTPVTDPAPIQAMRDERETAWMAYLDQYAGVETQRFLLPTPKETKQR